MKITKETLDEVFDQTQKLITLYKKSNLPIPFALKGNLGEFVITLELLKRFPGHKIDYRGGANPGIDISIDSVRIQVKTQIKHDPRKFKNGEVDFESSPAIKKGTLDKKKCDILILTILYFDRGYSQIEKKHIYVFNQDDFQYFSPNFCWSGKSRGDKTIVNILSVKGEPPAKLKEAVDFYNKPLYKKLFRESKDNWGKIEFQL